MSNIVISGIYASILTFFLRNKLSISYINITVKQRNDIILIDNYYFD